MKHFNREDFEHSLASGELSFVSSFRRTLRRDEVGVCAYPTVYPPKPLDSIPRNPDEKKSEKQIVHNFW